MIDVSYSPTTDDANDAFKESTKDNDKEEVVFGGNNSDIEESDVKETTHDIGIEEQQVILGMKVDDTEENDEKKSTNDIDIENTEVILDVIEESVVNGYTDDMGIGEQDIILGVDNDAIEKNDVKESSNDIINKKT